MSSRRGILLVSNFLSASGKSRGVCEELAVRLGEAGWAVWTTSNISNPLFRLFNMLWTAWKLRKRYGVVQMDVFSGAAFVWAEAVAGLLHLLRKPFVLTLHGGNLPAYAERWPWRVRRLLNSATAVTAPSRFLQQSLAGYRGDIILIPNPIEISNYPFRLRTDPQPRLVWLRAFHQIYNPALAVQVLADLLERYPDASLIMVGPDKGDGSLQQTRAAVAELELGDKVTITGAVPKSEVPEWLARGDIFLNTTDIDNTPISVLEAMACGLPIVSTNVGGLPDLIESGEDGLLVPPRCCDLMVDAIRSIIADPAVADNFSRNAREKAEGFGWENILPLWEKLLHHAWRANGIKA